MYRTDMYEGMIAETVSISGADNDIIYAYLARPLGKGPFPGIVLAHHMPGWDEWYREATRRYAHHGYVAICPNLYQRVGHGSPEDVAAKARSDGGIPDAQAVGDLEGSMRYLRGLPNVSTKIGIFGTCSGGRHACLAACRTDGFDAVVDCWGGNVVMKPEQLTSNQPVAPLDHTRDLQAPLLGLFGAEDQSPTPAQVAIHEQVLKEHGKSYDFHMYEGAGHGFFYYDRAPYRQEQAVDGWNKIFAFLDKDLSGTQ